MDKIKYLVGKKAFHICTLIVIISIMLFILGFVILKYNVEGETNMPFNLSKIALISSSEGIDVQSTENRWEFNINQINDIYLYVEKNSNYNKTSAIKSINIENFNFESVEESKIKIYKPDANPTKTTFTNSESNIVENIEYLGDINSNIKELKISNQGGLMTFRISNTDVAKYKSDDEEINHIELLKKTEIKNKQLEFVVNFDLIIKLEDEKEFKTTIKLNLPTGNLIEEGTTSTEITDLSKFIFKRIKN